MFNNIRNISMKYSQKGIEMILLKLPTGGKLLINCSYINTDLHKAMEAAGVERIDDINVAGLDTYTDSITGHVYKLIIIEATAGIFHPMGSSRVELDFS